MGGACRVAVGVLVAGAAFVAGVTLATRPRVEPSRPVDAAVELGTIRTTLVDRCGELIRTEAGVPLEIEVPLFPPPLDDRALAGSGGDTSVGELDVADPPVPVTLVPPYPEGHATCS